MEEGNITIINPSMKKGVRNWIPEDSHRVAD